jgi:N-acyl-D-amino-acid deacylase
MPGLVAGLHKVSRGAKPARGGMLWLDAHPDFNTPETTRSGSLGGMPVAVATGRALQRLRMDAQLDPPMPDELVVMGGVRLTDPLEQELLNSSRIQQITVDDLRQATPALFAQLDRLNRIADKIYVHIDMDVLDPREVMGHGNKVPGGPSSEELARLFETIFRKYPKASAIGFATIPSVDEGGLSIAAVNRMIAAAVKGVQSRGTGSSPREGQSAAISQPPAPSDYDVILRNGTVVDGSGGTPFRADVALAGSRIAAIGTLTSKTARLELDVKGLIVAPGFINIHSHASAAALPRADNMLMQGVTTEILNADGSGQVDLSAQLASLQGGGLAVNVGAYIGFNRIWTEVVGPSDRRPTSEEVDRMRGLVTAGLEAGAWGVSSGLDYKPAYFAATDEVTRVVSAAGAWRTNFTNHDRLTPEHNYSSKAGMAETIAIAADAGLVAVVTHMKVQGRERGSVATTLAAMRRATAAGHYTAADVYPYLAGQTALGALLIPAWAQDGGRPEMLKRFADPQQRAKIAVETEQAIKARLGGAENIYLPVERKQLTAVMTELDAPPGETVIRLLEQGNPTAIMTFGLETDLRGILKYRDASIACDCGATTSTTTHPRNYGTFPRVLGRYVRDDKVLTLQDAVRKMTALPAATIGMIDRGWIAVGMMADVTVFDPATVIDRATYEDPALPSEGIRHVFVNGLAALKDGAATGSQAGKILLRKPHMPSRPMSTGSRQVSVRDATLAASLTQSAAARRATGKLSVKDEFGKPIELADLGVLQTLPGWASITGRIRTPPGAAPAFATITVDRANPLSTDKGGKVTIELDDAPADLSRVDALVQAEMARQKIPGVAVAIVRKGQTIKSQGYGLANVEHDIKVTPATIFQSGSVGKQFTAAVVMLLVEDGKLSLTDPLTKFFPDAPPAWQRITVRHLLTHTSGIPDYTGGTIDYRRDYTEEELVKFAYALKPEFEPGARWNYSNTGYVLLGALVRKATGQFYGDVLRERVFGPLGMQTARIISEEDIVAHRAGGYRLVKGALKNQEWVAPRLNTTADGSLYLSLTDMLAWAAGVRAGRVLKPESWRQVFSPVTLNSGKTYPYGFGWSVEDFVGHRAQRHGGSWQGFKTHIARYPDDDLTIIVLANAAQADPERISDGIAAALDPAFTRPVLKPIPSTDPAVDARVRKLLSDAAAGRLSPEEFAYVRAGFFPSAANAYAAMLRQAGEVRSLVLLENREHGDDRIYTYDVLFAERRLRLRLAVAPDGKLAAFGLSAAPSGKPE